MNNQKVWDSHYTRARARQLYPDENVVRILKKDFSHLPQGTGTGKEDLLSAGAPARPCTRALDLGAGSGRHLSLLAEHFDEVHACDFSLNSLQLYPRERVAAVQAMLPDLPYADASLDFVLCWGVLHYLPRPALLPALAEIRRILKPGGSVFLTLRADADTHLRAQLSGGDLSDGHAGLFSKAETLALFAAFTATQYGFISRQPLGEDGIVAHHMVAARRPAS